MQNAYDLRNAVDRERLVALLPEIDGYRYSLTSAEFADAIAAVAEFLPSAIDLHYQAGFMSIFRTGAGIYNLVELGRWFRKLAPYDGFPDLVKGFSNPTQFWDSYFETRVAAYFATAPGVDEIRFSPELVVRGRAKHPEFVAIGPTGELVVECKQLRVYDSKRARKFGNDVDLIRRAQDGSSWPDDYCLEIEFLASETEFMPIVATKLVRRAVEAATAGGDRFRVDNIAAIVRHRDEPLQTDRNRRGLYRAVLRSPGYPISLADTRHQPLHAFRGDISKRYWKLFQAAINNARTQLPPDRNCAV
jgi:hypothetical protein